MALGRSSNNKNKTADASSMSLVNIIEAYVEQLSNINTIINKTKLDESSIKRMSRVIESSISILKILDKNKKIIEKVGTKAIGINAGVIKKNFETIKLIVTTLTSISELNKIKVSDIIRINLLLDVIIRTTIRVIQKASVLSGMMLGMVPIQAQIAAGMRLLNSQMKSLVEVFTTLDKLKPMGVVVKMPLILLAIDQIVKLVVKLATLQVFASVIMKSVQTVLELALIATALNIVFKQIRSINIMFLQIKLHSIVRALHSIVRIVQQIGSLRISKKAVAKVLELVVIFNALKLVFIAVAAAAFFAILATLGAPLVALALLSIWLVIKAIGLLRVDLKTIIGLLLLTAVMSLVMVLCVELAITSQIAKDISFISLLAFFGALLVVVVLVTLIGLAIVSIAPLAMFILAGLAFMFIVVTGLLLLAAELKLVEVLNLDGDKVKASVSVVVDTALSIIDILFGAISDKTDNSKENDSVFSRFAKKMLGGLGMLLEVILVIPILLMSIVSVTLILFMATVLRILQTIKLEPKRIAENVTVVLNTAKSVMNQLFHSDEEKITEDKSNDESWKRKVVDFMAGSLKGIGTVLDAVFAVATLAMTVISVTLILLIATELRILQTLDLDPDKIYNNVTLVIDTARTIASRIIHGADDQENPKRESRSFVRDIIEFFGDALGGLVTIIDSILAVGVLAMSILSVAILYGIASMLNKIQDIQLDRNALTEKTNTIISCANHIKSVVFHQEDKGSNDTSSGEKKSWISRGWDAVKGFGRAVVGTVKGFVDGVGNLGASAVLATSLSAVLELLRITEALNSINELDIQREAIQNKVTDILNVSRFVGSSVTDSTIGTIDHDKVSDFGRFAKYVKNLVKAANKVKPKKVRDLQESLLSVISTNSKITIDRNKVYRFHRYAADSVRLMKHINSLNTDKLVKYSDMWAKMTEFMQEIKDLNIEELSDAIVNKIAPAMSDISDNVDSMSKAKPNSETQITNPPSDSGKPVVASVADNNNTNKPKMSDPTRILEDIKSLLVDYFESRI